MIAFTQRVERAAEEACLLTGDDGYRPRVAELLGGGHRSRRRVATALLRRDDVRHTVARADVVLRARDRFTPGARIRGISVVEGRQPAEVVGVIRGQAAHPGEPSQIDWKAGGRGGDGVGEHQTVLSPTPRTVSR